MVRRPAPRLLVVLVPVILLISACSDGEGGGPTDPSGTPTPGAIEDLRIVEGGPGRLTLNWTVPDIVSKALVEYELRMIPFVLAEGNPEDWPSAYPPQGRESGVSQFFTLADLEPDETYALTLRPVANGQAGPWSAVVVGTAAVQTDQTPPAAIDDLQFWSSSATSLTCTWSPGGDDGVFGQATAYEVRYGENPIEDATWTQGMVVLAEIEDATSPGLLQVTIDGLQEGVEYHVAVCAIDENDQRSAVGPNLVRTAGEHRTWYVKEDGSGDVPTIEAALAAVQPGDVIRVAAGRYTWSNQQPSQPFYGLVFIDNGKSDFLLISEAGPEQTILDAEGEGNVVWVFGNNENVTVDGFTITGGYVDNQADARYAGGGVVVHLASPTIQNCVITGNYAVEGGGVWFGSTGRPRLVDCLVEDNEAVRGGGVCLINDAQRMEISGCLIRNNTAFQAGGGFFDYNALFTMSDCVVTGNQSFSKGGGLSMTTLHADTRIERTSIIFNSGDLGGGVRLAENSVPTLEGCIIAFNEGAAFSTVGPSGVAMGCSVVWGNTGGDQWPSLNTDLGGNFSLDPGICDETTGSLHTDSPCRVGQHPEAEECGGIGGSRDICYE